MKRTAFAVAVLVLAILAALVVACPATEGDRRVKGFGPPGTTATVPSFSYSSGADGGIVVVPNNRYVSSIWAEGAGTIQVTPSGQSMLPPCVGSKADAGWLVFDGGWRVLDGGWIVRDGGFVHTDAGHNDAGWHVGDGGDKRLDGGAIRLDGGAVRIDGGRIYVDGGACNVPGPVITIGAGVTYSIAASGNGLRGAANELADGTRIVFSGGTRYVVTMNAYGPQ